MRDVERARREAVWELSASALAALVILAGCGVGDVATTVTEAEEPVASTVEELTVALLEGDGESACRLLTRQARDEVLATFLASKGTSGLKDCAAAVSTLEKDAPPAVETVIDTAEAGELVDSVSIEGESATATIDDADVVLEIELELRDGDWLVSEPQQLLFGASG